MTISSFILQQRRTLALCVATLALHYLSIAWVGAHIGPLQQHPPKVAPSVISAQLRLAPVPVRVVAPAAPPAPVPRPRLARRAKPAPPAEVEPVDLGPAPGPEPETLAAPAAAEVAGAASVPRSAAPAQSVVAAPVSLPPEAPEPASTETPLRHFRVALPPSADLELRLLRIDPDGAVWNGEAVMNWRQDGASYTLGVEAGIGLLITRVNLLVLSSEGLIDESGIAPVRATEKRKGRALTATHFDRAGGQVTFSASERVVKLQPGTQDKATLPLQLAGIGRADPRQFADGLEIMVGEEREVSPFRFVVVGLEQIDTRLGSLAAWHLSRPPLAGSYNSKLEIWLAPERDWYPVQIRNTESNGAVTTQSVTKIVLTGTGK